MLKRFLSISLVLITLLINLCSTISYAETITLNQIVTKFNNSSVVEEYNEQGYNLAASTNDNKLIISMSGNEIDQNFEYILNGSILATTLSGENAFYGLFVTLNLVDIIGQLHGYEEGEIYSTLNSDEISNYTVENDGFEAKQLEDGSYQIKIDINKKIPLIDSSDVYFEVSDLDDLKKYLIDSGSAQQTKGNIIFHKSGDNNITLFVGEKKDLTKNAYKSILSILQVMFDDENVVEYFKTNYNSDNFSLGNKEFTGFKIEINPEKSDMENVVLGKDDTYKFVRLTIDKNLVKNTVNGNNDQDDEENNGNEIEEAGDDTKINKENENINKYENNSDGKVIPKEDDKSKTLPKSGLSRGINLIIIGVGVSLIIWFLKLHNLRDSK